MFKVGLICLVITTANAAYSNSGAGASSGTYGYGNYGSKFPYSNQYAGGYVGTGNGGYGGAGFGGAGFGAGPGFGFSGFAPLAPLPPLPPIPTPYDYSQFVNNFLGGLQNQYANAGAGSSYAYATPEATAFAQSSLDPYNNLYNQHLAHQAQLYNSVNAGGNKHGNNVNYGGASAGSYAPNFAGASGSYGGPGGFHQTATIYPANPGSPNLDSRFGGDAPNGQGSVSFSGTPGYVGISTSSFSSSSDVNGEKKQHREAITSINDNGKVTTYRVHS